jgi:hypothetical protein
LENPPKKGKSSLEIAKKDDKKEKTMRFREFHMRLIMRFLICLILLGLLALLYFLSIQLGEIELFHSFI